MLFAANKKLNMLLLKRPPECALLQERINQTRQHESPRKACFRAAANDSGTGPVGMLAWEITRISGPKPGGPGY